MSTSVDAASRWHLIVIGAGPAGLLAATRAAERGGRVLLLEKNRKPGVKILMSGGTRCNLTQATDARGIVAAFGPQGPFLHSALARFSPIDLVALIEAEGVPTKREPTGKIFPASDRALDIQQALLRRLARSGAVLQTGTPVTQVAFSETASRFAVQTADRVYTSQRLLITTGGLSYPGCGTTGDGYGWARQMGHVITRCVPALVPLRSSEAWVHELSGVTLSDVSIHAVLAGTTTSHRSPPSRRRTGNDRSQSRGGLLFTHFGLSGPAPLNVSRNVTLADPEANGMVCCDFLPDQPREDIEQEFTRRITSEGKRPVTSLLEGLLPARVSAAILGQAEIAPQKKLAELSRADRVALVDRLKSLAIPLAGALGYEKAEVTAGGVALDEVDPRTMASRKHPGLYFAGEILDLDGPIGGFNFQAAFSTAWLAVESMAFDSAP